MPRINLPRPRVTFINMGGRFVPIAARSPCRFFSAAASPECLLTCLSGSDSGIALLKLNRPSTKNAIGSALSLRMEEILANILSEQRTSIRVLILKSEVDHVFSAGADLKERRSMNEAQVAQFTGRLRTLLTTLATLPMPVIAAVDGVALGGGLELALAADLRVAGPSARLGLPETKLAIIPGAGGTQRLARLVGSSRAKELIFTGRILSGAEALQAGIVNHYVDGTREGETAFSKALDLAREILPQGPVALRMAKQAIDQGIEMDLHAGLAFERACYAQVIPTQDRLEGLRAFAEKRKPVYTGA